MFFPNLTAKVRSALVTAQLPEPMVLKVALRDPRGVPKTITSADQFMKRNYRKLQRTAAGEPYQDDKGCWFVDLTYNPKEAKKP